MNNIIYLPVRNAHPRVRKLPVGQRLMIIAGLGVASWAVLITMVTELTR